MDRKVTLQRVSLSARSFPRSSLLALPACSVYPFSHPRPNQVINWPFLEFNGGEFEISVTCLPSNKGFKTQLDASFSFNPSASSPILFVPEDLRTCQRLRSDVGKRNSLNSRWAESLKCTRGNLVSS